MTPPVGAHGCAPRCGSTIDCDGQLPQSIPGIWTDIIKALEEDRHYTPIMELQERRSYAKPDPHECPGGFCFHWCQQGSHFAQGLYENLEEALSQAVLVQDSGCGCSFGV